MARSADGVSGWRIAPEPLLRPATVADRYAPGVDPAEIVRVESGGVEDPRINVVDGEYAINQLLAPEQKLKVSVARAARCSRCSRS